MTTPQAALDRLVEGNRRFYEGTALHPNRCEEARSSLLREQKPHIAVLSCSDSRVPVEIIFDAGLGDIFTVRTAGHVLSKEVLGSLEYAVMNLGVKLVMILGHEHCGAIKSALNSYHNADDYAKLSENVQSIVKHIYPVFDEISSDCSSEENVHCAVHANIKYQVSNLISSDKYIEQKIKSKEVMVVGACYNLLTGKIEIVCSSDDLLAAN